MAINTFWHNESLELDFDIEAFYSSWVDDRTNKTINSFVTLFKHGEKSIVLHAKDISKIQAWLEELQAEEEFCPMCDCKIDSDTGFCPNCREFVR